jgi:uncharacterized protein YcfJ
MKATLRNLGMLALAAGLSAGGAMAAQAQTYNQGANYSEWAAVISATPVMERINQPREECATERVTNYENRRVGGISLGAFETSTNYVVPVTRDVQRCRTVDQVTEVVQGYDVRYRYNGREYVTRTATDPGARIRVDVSVLPGAQ